MTAQKKTISPSKIVDNFIISKEMANLLHMQKLKKKLYDL